MSRAQGIQVSPVPEPRPEAGTRHRPGNPPEALQRLSRLSETRLLRARGNTSSYVDRSGWFKGERRDQSPLRPDQFQHAQATMRRLEKSFAEFYRRVKGRGESPAIPASRPGTASTRSSTPPTVTASSCSGATASPARRYDPDQDASRRSKGRSSLSPSSERPGKWFPVFSCDLGDVAIEPSTNPAVGIDVGLKAFLQDRTASGRRTALPEDGVARTPASPTIARQEEERRQEPP